MSMRRFRAPSPALVIALLALFVALGGTTYAATSLPRNSVGTKQLRKSAVTAAKIRNRAVTAHKINTKGLVVPSAAHAASADNATTAGHATTAGTAAPSGSAGGALAGTYPHPSLAAPEAWHEIGAGGQPAFENRWTNESPTSNVTAAFYRDPLGVVHLKGRIANGSTEATVFTLPAGYRPGKALGEVVYEGGGVAELVIGSDGKVIVNSFGSGVVDLDGVTFRVGE